MATRRLSPEERELWRRVVSDTAPLHPPAATASVPDPVVPEPPRIVDVPKSPRRRTAAPAEPPKVTLDLAPDPQDALRRESPLMDRRRFEQMRRGKLEPDARLDLHGMTLEAAHAALTGFVLSAHASDLRLLLVITGKGRAPDGGQWPQRHGILRHGVPHWLAAPPLASRVLDVVPAHQRHGGGGAYYVYLRRKR